MSDFVEIMILWPVFWAFVFAILWCSLFGFDPGDK